MPIISSVVVSQLIRLQQLALASATYVENPAYDLYMQKKEMGKLTSKQIKRGPPPKYLITLIEPSSKLDEFMKLLGDNENSQFILFSQSRQMIELTEKRLTKEGYSVGLYTGKRSQSQKEDAVEGFTNKKHQIFAGTIAAGGEGIDGLQVAHNMLFFDRDWRQSKNLQAEARGRRPGQEADHVMIYDVMAKDTVDLGRRVKILKKYESVKKLLGDDVDPISITENDAGLDEKTIDGTIIDEALGANTFSNGYAL